MPSRAHYKRNTTNELLFCHGLVVRRGHRYHAAHYGLETAAIFAAVPAAE